MDKKNSQISDGISMTESEEAKRLREKINSRNEAVSRHPHVAREELPDMEKNCKTDAENQAEANKLKEKADNGAVAVVNKVMKQPEVQNIIKKNVNKQTFISGLFMAFLLIGFLMLSNVAKEVLKYSWQGDLAIGVVLIVIGGAYMVKEIGLKKS